jgi:hypothetical protein
MEKTNMLKFKTSNLPHQPLTVGYKQKYIKEITNIKFLGIKIDSSLTWKNHIDQMIPKLSAACYALRMIYFGCFHSVMEYGVIFGGNSAGIDKVFKLQKTIVRIMAGVRSKCSCRGLFKKLDVLPVSCQYIFSLMIFVVDNLGSFQTNLTVHGLNRRNKTQLHRPIAKISCFQKGVSYAAVKIFDSLPSSISKLGNYKKQFKPALWRYLMTHCFYSINEFQNISKVAISDKS